MFGHFFRNQRRVRTKPKIRLRRVIVRASLIEPSVRGLPIFGCVAGDDPADDPCPQARRWPGRRAYGQPGEDRDE
jgi:hypothetical protein